MCGSVMPRPQRPGHGRFHIFTHSHLVILLQMSKPKTFPFIIFAIFCIETAALFSSCSDSVGCLKSVHVFQLRERIHGFNFLHLEVCLGPILSSQYSPRSLLKMSLRFGEEQHCLFCHFLWDLGWIPPSLPLVSLARS